MRNENTLPQKYLYKNVQTGLLIITKYRKQPRCSSIGKWVSQLQYIPTMRLLTNKKNKLLIYATQWTTPDGRNQIPQRIQCMTSWQQKSDDLFFCASQVGIEQEFLRGNWGNENIPCFTVVWHTNFFFNSVYLQGPMCTMF